VGRSGGKLLQIELKEVPKVPGLKLRVEPDIVPQLMFGSGSNKVPKQDKVFIGIISAHETMTRRAKYD